MAFFKDTASMILYFIVYIAVAVQCATVLMAEADTHLTYIVYHKCFFFLMVIMSIWSHYKASITIPGIITAETNPIYLDFYLRTHYEPIQRAERYNSSHAKSIFDNIDDEDLKDNESMSEDDSFEYKAVTSISDEYLEKIKSQYKIDLKRCDKCYIVRVPRVHHCSVCRGCVLKMDHHCPWINNCVGHFNQKFFIQFCSYCFWGCLDSLIVTGYYLIYKNKS
jgi:hypothetical protein